MTNKPFPYLPDQIFSLPTKGRHFDDEGFTTSDIIFDPSDSRRPVENTDLFPYRDIALVQAFNDSGQLRNVGTAFRFTQGVAVSAAHVVQNPNAFRDHSSASATVLHLWFGFSSGRAEGAFVKTRDFVIHPQYDPLTGKGTDVVAIRLPSSFPYYPEKIFTGTGSPQTEYRLAGFPADGPSDGLTMMEGASRTAEVALDRLFHQIDATEGQSGAPIWWVDGSEIHIAAIHNEGTSATYDPTFIASHKFLANGALLLTPDLCEWILNQE